MKENIYICAGCGKGTKNPLGWTHFPQYDAVICKKCTKENCMVSEGKVTTVKPIVGTLQQTHKEAFEHLNNQESVKRLMKNLSDL